MSLWWAAPDTSITEIGGRVGFHGPIPLWILLIHPTLSRPLKPTERPMTIEIRDASLEARIQEQLQATGSSSVEEVLLRLLEATCALSS